MQNTYRNTISFDNGYSASIVSNEYSYGGDRGLFEVAVIFDGQIVYDTPITSDVMGFLGFSQVAEALEAISKLPSR